MGLKDKIWIVTVPETGLLFCGANLLAEVLQLELLLLGVFLRQEDVPVSNVFQVNEVPVVQRRQRQVSIDVQTSPLTVTPVIVTPRLQ